MSAVLIARCPVHGLHGLRTTCFAFEHEGARDCDGTVEQVAMVPVEMAFGAAVDRLRVRAGDVVVLRLAKDLPRDDMADIGDVLKSVLPSDACVLILPPGYGLGVLEPAS